MLASIVNAIKRIKAATNIASRRLRRAVRIGVKNKVKIESGNAIVIAEGSGISYKKVNKSPISFKGKLKTKTKKYKVAP